MMASTMLHEKCCNTVLQIGAPVRQYQAGTCQIDTLPVHPVPFSANIVVTNHGYYSNGDGLLEPTTYILRIFVANGLLHRLQEDRLRAIHA